MDEYTNNLHARIDNIIADAYFGAGGGGVNYMSGEHPTMRKTILHDSSSNFYSNLLWLIFGVILGVVICYVSLDEDTRQQIKSTLIPSPDED